MHCAAAAPGSRIGLGVVNQSAGFTIDDHFRNTADIRGGNGSAAGDSPKVDDAQRAPNVGTSDTAPFAPPWSSAC